MEYTDSEKALINIYRFLKRVIDFLKQIEEHKNVPPNLALKATAIRWDWERKSGNLPEAVSRNAVLGDVLAEIKAAYGEKYGFPIVGDLDILEKVLSKYFS